MSCSTPDDVPSAPTTYFAPAERAAPEAVQEAVDLVSASPVMAGLLRTLGGILMVVNEQRQIVAANDELLRFLGCNDPQGTLGLRPGEALGCIHAADNPQGGCGTGRFCATCGAAIAIVSSQQSEEPAEAECLLTVRMNDHEEAFEFRVRAAPIHVGGQRLTVISVQDIRDEKRREALESTFFHDIMNTATALQSATRALATCDGAERQEAIQAAADLCERLIMEIAAQRELIDLESGRYETRMRYVACSEIRQLARHFFAGQPVAAGRTLTFCDGPDDAMTFTDPTLLGRVLANMITNALEATPVGGEVRVWWDAEAGRVTFHVANAAAMAPEVALRVFQRYFTTKSQRGRGLGTYGMKLIGERYLGGRVYFTTSEAEGTTFHIELPREAAGRA